MSERHSAQPSMSKPPLSRQLNLGCGLKRRDDCFNVDQAKHVQPDLVWNLDEFPYPLPASHFRNIFAHDVVEHLASIPDFMGEVHRKLEPDGVIEITTPHFSCANSFTDPTHRHHLGYFSFEYFTVGHELNFYTDVRFEILERQIVFQHSLVNRIVRTLANKYPHDYEQRYAWMFPAWFLIFKLRAAK